MDVVTQLTDRHEQTVSSHWSVGDAPPDYISAMLRAIVGVEISAEHIVGKLKLSQNKSPEAVCSIVRSLRELGDVKMAETAVWMERVRDCKEASR